MKLTNTKKSPQRHGITLWAQRQNVRLSAAQTSLATARRNFGAGHFLRSFVFFVFTTPVAAAYSLLQFLLQLPFYVAWGPTRTFEILAPRAQNGTYLRSYSSALKQHQLTAATVTTVVFLFALKVVVTIVLTSLILPSRPVEAVSSSVTLNPTWDQTSYRHDILNPFPDCDVPFPDLNCESAAATTLKTGETQSDVGCDPGLYDSYTYRGAMMYSLASIPDTATITDVSLTLNVSTATPASVTILRTTVDDITLSTCTASGSTGIYSRMGTGLTLTTASDWNTTGLKTYDLGTTADSEAQTRLTGSDTITIGLSAAAVTIGEVSSVDAASNKPQLVISYTAPPQAPTGFGHSAVTTSSVTWSWTDNATADTSNVIHNGSHSVMCSTGAVSGTGSTGSCVEGSLAANTQYTRHANVIDHEGNTDSTPASAYTLIQTPTGTSITSVTSDSITVNADGTLTNLNSGFSGIWCQESTTAANSGWMQATSWTHSNLDANTQYIYRCKARNSDGLETSFTSAAALYTAAAPPSVTASATMPVSTLSPVVFTQSSWGQGSVHYLRYIINDQAAYSFLGTESTWSSETARCPDGACTLTSSSLTVAPDLSGNIHYLHVQSYNTENLASWVQNIPFWFTVTPAGGTVPSPTITSPKNNEIVYDRRPSFSGRVKVGTTLTVLVDKKVNGTKKITGSGATTVAFVYRPSRPFSYGVHRLTMYATNASGDESVISTPRTFIVAEPTTPKTLAQSSVTKGDRPSVTITGRPKTNGYVRIYFGGNLLKTVQLKKYVSWHLRIVPSKSLKKGTYVIALQFLNTKKAITSTSRLTSLTIRR